jgi:PAS domain S-box-containing protein
VEAITIIFIFLAVTCAIAAAVFFVRSENIRKRLKGISTDNTNYENIIQQANDAMFVIDIVDGKIYTANPKLSELLGYEHEKLLSLTVFDLHPKELLSRSSEVIADVWEKKGLIYTDVPLLTASGEVLSVECSAKVIPYDGRPAILIYARDIRDRLRMEKDIRDKNKIIEEKNKDITDSINYARRIQQAILSDKSEIKRYLPESFVLFKPKDIVSGDFYWFTHRDGTTFIAAADCTGHGVPGAIMSMIANSFLNEVVSEKNILQPDLILNELREKIIKALRQTGETMENRDGLDISLCAIKGYKLLFAGANNPVWIIRRAEHTSEFDNENPIKNDKYKLVELPPCKQPIGTHPRPHPFQLRSLDLAKGDTVYLFSDGYADQFGGPKGKKFMYRNFADLLLSIQENKMEEQKNILDAAIMSWRADIDQVDDILVVGFML